MKIISVPHPTLRQVASPVTQVDTKFKKFLAELGQTLLNQHQPRGVGLAANQVDELKRVFATNISQSENDDRPNLRLFINPEITDHSSDLIFGPPKQEEILEGCLSIPSLYGPVPRFAWVELQYLVWHNDELITQKDRFSDYEARVVQHELDHLNGVLFTDYSLEYDLPVYKENKKTKKLEEIDKRVLEAF